MEHYTLKKKLDTEKIDLFREWIVSKAFSYSSVVHHYFINFWIIINQFTIRQTDTYVKIGGTILYDKQYFIFHQSNYLTS